MTSPPHFQIVYPECRTIDAARVRAWFADACEMGELNALEASEAVAEDCVELMAACLHDAGVITLARYAGPYVRSV